MYFPVNKQHFAVKPLNYYAAHVTPGFPFLSWRWLFSVQQEVVIEVLAHLYLTVASKGEHFPIPAIVHQSLDTF